MKIAASQLGHGAGTEYNESHIAIIEAAHNHRGQYDAIVFALGMRRGHKYRFTWIDIILAPCQTCLALHIHLDELRDKRTMNLFLYIP